MDDTQRLTEEDMAALMQNHEFRSMAQQHLQGGYEEEPDQVDSSIALQMAILKQEAKPDTAQLLTRDIFLGNLDDRDKNRVNNYLDIALRFRKLGLPKSGGFFYTRSLIISGVSRGYKGFQQKEFNARREFRESEIQGLRSSESMLPWRNKKN